eukprot:g2713.t1
MALAVRQPGTDRSQSVQQAITREGLSYELSNKTEEQKALAITELASKGESFVVNHLDHIVAELRRSYKDCVEDLRQTLNDASPEVQGAACLALAKVGAAGAAFAPAVAQKLADPRSRLNALKALGLMGLAGGKHCSDVVECLCDDDGETRTLAASIVGRMSEYVKDTPTALNRILDIVRDEDLSHAPWKVPTFQLQMVGSKPGGCRRRLPPSCRKSKCAAAAALGSIAAEDQGFGWETAAGQVARLLDEDDWEVKTCALECLAALGRRAREHVDKVIGQMGDERYIVRAKAAFADNCPAVKSAAALGLAELGDDGAEYSHKVFNLLTDISADVRAAAVTALARMRDRGPHFATVIAQRLKAEGEEPKVRIAAMEALSALEERAMNFMDLIREQQRDRSLEKQFKSIGMIAATIGDSIAVDLLADDATLADCRRTEILSSFFQHVRISAAFGPVPFQLRDPDLDQCLKDAFAEDSLESPGLEMEEVQDEPNMPQDVAADEATSPSNAAQKEDAQIRWNHRTLRWRKFRTSPTCHKMLSQMRPQALRTQRQKRTRSAFLLVCCFQDVDSLKSPGLEVEDVQDEPHMPQDVVADEATSPSNAARKEDARRFSFSLLFLRCYIANFSLQVQWNATDWQVETLDKFLQLIGGVNHGDVQEEDDEVLACEDQMGEADDDGALKLLETRCERGKHEEGDAESAISAIQQQIEQVLAEPEMEPEQEPDHDCRGETAATFSMI